MGTLYYGDNLDILRRYLKDESVDLVYLDPPFNSAQNYNAFFHEKDGTDAASQIRAFEDTWHWDIETKKAYDAVTEQPGKVSDVMQAFYTFLGGNDMMAYLTMMSARLVELRRVLKPTGSLYLHCDPTASHYLKLLCDAVFGQNNYVNEISWKRTTTKNDYQQGAFNWPRIHDIILYYAKDAKIKPIFKQPFTEYGEDYVKAKYPYTDEKGRRYGLWDLTAPGSGMRGHPKYEVMGVTRYWRYGEEKMQQLIKDGRVIQPSPGSVPRYKRFLDEMHGIAIGDLFDDIPPINSQAIERLGYPTQKPVALLERIIQASSNPGDVVLDPFCGCGTTIDAAEKNGRDWIGIDVTQLAISLIKNRLQDTYGRRLKFVSGSAAVSSPSPPPREERVEERRHVASKSSTPLPDPLPASQGEGKESGHSDAGVSLVRIIGEPTTPNEAATLAEDDKYQFQWWALGLVGARPVEQKKGADHGIDGKILFRDDPKAAKPEQIIIQIKGGKTGVKDVRDLRGVLEREKAAIGVLISLQPPTGPMETEAASAGFYEHKTNKQKYPRLQLRTVKELMDGKGIERPTSAASLDDTFKKAPQARAKGHQQDQLGI